MASRRRADARQQIITLTLEMNTLLEPSRAGETYPDGTPMWSMRQSIENSIAELRKVEAEALAVLQEPFTS